MNNVQNGAIYFGNLMKIVNGKDTLYRENVCLIYDEKVDKFYSLENTLNYFFDVSLNKNLTSEEKEKLKEIIKNYEYAYKPNNIDGEIYVDINSLKELKGRAK